MALACNQDVAMWERGNVVTWFSIFYFLFWFVGERNLERGEYNSFCVPRRILFFLSFLPRATLSSRKSSQYGFYWALVPSTSTIVQIQIMKLICYRF